MSKDKITAPMARLYEFKGQGLALASVIIIQAPTEARARLILKQVCEKEKINEKTVQLIRITTFEPPCLLYFWNGDY